MIVFLSSLSPLGALDDFEDDVKEEEAQEDDEDEETDDENEDNANNRDEDGEQSFTGAILSLFLDLTGFAWSEHIGSIHYEDFPYAYGSPDFVRSRRRDHTPAASSGRRQWFKLSGGALASPDTGFGYTASFEGRITPYIGPSLQFRSIYDAGDYLNVTTAGGDISLVQTDPVHLSAYLQGAWFHGILNRAGVSTGLRVRSFPRPPVSFDVAAGLVSFQQIDFLRVDGALRRHFDRFAVFGGAGMLQSENARLTTIDAGISIYF